MRRSKQRPQNEPVVEETPIPSARDLRREMRDLKREEKSKTQDQDLNNGSAVEQAISEEPMFQEIPTPTDNNIPTFRTPRFVSQEALRAFFLQAVGITRIFPSIEDNQESTTKPSKEIHSQADVQHF